VRGCAIDRGSEDRLLDKEIRPALVGQDLFAVERHLKAGLVRWGALEHAIWDAIGKLAGRPVHRLLGGSAASLKVYLTVVWRGNADQSQVAYREQAEMAARIKQAGFKGMKIRAWRPNPMDDVDACGEIRAAVGPDFAILFDRTADLPGLWDYATALKVARGLEKHNAYWLEEPLDRKDFVAPARLGREVKIPITGGERFQGLESYRECLVNRTYSVLQPDAVICGGILMTRKIATLAEAFHVPVVLHGAMGLRLAGPIQASAAIGAEWQELAIITPPLMPEEQWSPALRVIKSKTLFTIHDGQIEVPQGPGLGLDLDDEALERFRGGKDRSFYPQYPG
jgi:L-alanine-DL-glutamate epimerase-like enolase superfamily enzyme